MLIPVPLIGVVFAQKSAVKATAPFNKLSESFIDLNQQKLFLMEIREQNC
jgi:hypothetical protein